MHAATEKFDINKTMQRILYILVVSNPNKLDRHTIKKKNNNNNNDPCHFGIVFFLIYNLHHTLHQLKHIMPFTYSLYIQCFGPIHCLISIFSYVHMKNMYLIKFNYRNIFPQCSKFVLDRVEM